jgi:hypothetical protein
MTDRSEVSGAVHHMTKDQIVAMSTDELYSIVRSTKADGCYWVEILIARAEIERRLTRTINNERQPA